LTEKKHASLLRHKQNHDGGELRNLKKQRAPANAAANTDRNTWITIKGKTMIVGKGEGGEGVNWETLRRRVCAKVASNPDRNTCNTIKGKEPWRCETEKP
jgi:hypothetical protein